MKIKTITKKALYVGVLSAFSSPVLALQCQSYAYTGAPETLTVPTGATQAVITAVGADGGNAVNRNGGAGGSAEATFTVTPGQTITTIVGEAGKSGDNFEAGGGGGSGVFLDNAVLIVAGGGGGGDNTGPGGGGGQSGEDGTSANTTGIGGGAGGTGGAGGDHGDDGVSGNPGTGGGGGGGLNSAGGTSSLPNSATGGGACLTAGAPTGGAGGKEFEPGHVDNANGGYGCGGGGAGSENESGGGGGYSGGGGAGASGYPGGGGTFVASTALSQTTTAGANGGGTLQNGEVEVCFLADSPNRVPATSIWSLLMLTGLISLFAHYYRLRR